MDASNETLAADAGITKGATPGLDDTVAEEERAGSSWAEAGGTAGAASDERAEHADGADFATGQARIAASEGYPFLFSVVIAAYNAEEDIAESIESIVGQTLGFEHIEIVVVDDGSTDGTAEICDRYAERFPANFTLISKENGGVSSARNTGIAAARGKYLNFLDSDDKWSVEAFEQTLEFFTTHPDVRMAAARYVMFGAKTGGHRLNYKFEEDAVVDLATTYDYPQLSSSTCFFHSELLKQRTYSEKLSVSEDTLIVNEILLDEMTYGVMSGPTYYYRQHEEKESAIDTMKDNVSWYLDTPRLCYRHLFDLSQRKHGRILPFVQYTVMYDLQWRIRAHASERLTAAQIAEYRELIVGLLRDIDDAIISEQRTISIDQVAYAFALKHGTTMDDIIDHAAVEGEELVSNIASVFDGGDGSSGADGRRRIVLRPLRALSDTLTVEHVGFDGKRVILDGYVTSFRFRPNDLALSLDVNNQPIECKLFVTDEHKPKTPFGEDIVGKTGFSCQFPIGAGQEVRLKAELTLLGAVWRPLRLRFDEESGLPKQYEEGAFLATGGVIFKTPSPNSLSVYLPRDDDDRKRTIEKAEAYHAAAASAPEVRHRAAPWRETSASNGSVS